MAKFKTGDRVRVVGHSEAWDGIEGVVEGLESDDEFPQFSRIKVRREGDGGALYFARDVLELVLRVEVAPTRSRILTEAEALVNGDREDTYGTPAESLGRIAGLWSVVLGQEIKPAQVALLLASLKVARLSVGLDHRDGWVDLAGYAAIGAEVANAQ